MSKLVTYIVIILIITIACQEKPSQTIKKYSIEQSDSIKIDSITNLINNNSQSAELYAQRSQLYINQGKLTSAIKDLIFANQIDSLNPEHYLHLSDFYLRMGKSDVVNDILQKGNRLIPNNKDILYRLGNLYLYIQDYKKSNGYLNEAVKVDRYFAEAWFSKGLVYTELGNTSEAIKYFQIAVEREPDYYDAYIQLALLYAEKADSIAIDYYDNALRLIPDSYEAIYGKAIFYQKNEQPANAQELYRYIIDNINSNLPEVFFNMGYIDMIYYEDYKNAISRFDSALTIYPVYIEAVYNKAFCYEKLGNKNKAYENYKNALKIDSQYDLAIYGLNRLDNK